MRARSLALPIASVALAAIIGWQGTSEPVRAEPLPPTPGSTPLLGSPLFGTTTTAAPAAPPAPPPPAVEPAHPTPAEAQLASQLNALLFNTNSCLEVRDAAGNVVYARGGGSPLAPASTQKLLTAAAALAILGPSYRFVTKVEAARAPVNGEVDDVWLVGGGDPVLSTAAYTTVLSRNIESGGLPVVTTPLSILINELKSAGVTYIPDGVHGDGSYFSQSGALPTWTPVYLSEGDVTRLSGLVLDDGLQSYDPATDAADPTGFAAGVFAQQATSAGILTKTAPDSAAPPNAVVLAQIPSQPLSAIVTEMLRNSDNNAAELLTLALDKARGGTGTTAGGVAVIENEAAALGFPTAGLALLDGSGLSSGARATCDTLFSALNATPAPELSVSGVYGTLVNRFLNTPAQGRLAGKTGSIGGVAGLVAHMNIGAGLSFSFLINGPFGYATGESYENSIVADLTAYP